MAIPHSPKTGEILECNFGNFQTQETGDPIDFNGRIPPEMIKRRMVVVLNGRLGKSSIVVPISSSKDQGGINQGHHVELDTELFPVTDVYDRRERWAKANLVQHVSHKRLFKIRENGRNISVYLPRETVGLIQQAAVKALNAGYLIK